MADGSTAALAGPVSGEWAGADCTLSGQLGGHPVEGIGQTRPDPDHLECSCVTRPVPHYVDTVQVVVG